MARRLKIHSIDSVGVVDEGDNPPARLMFWKRKQTPDSGDVEKGEPMDGETVAVPETQEAADTEVVVGPDIEKAAETPAEEGDDIVKRAEEAVAKAVAERDAAMQALADEVEKRENAEWVEKARPYELLLGAADTVGPALRKIAAACPQEWAVLEPALKAGTNREALAKILGEIGTDTSSELSPTEKRDRFVREMRKLHPDMSVEQARAQFWREHPEEKKASRE